MKRKDIPIIILTVVLAVLAYVFATSGDADKVSVYKDGKLLGEYSLSKNQSIDINGTNMLVIEDGEAFMTEADCPDKLCINQGKIGSKGGSIICLPNKVVVETKGGADAVSR